MEALEQAYLATTRRIVFPMAIGRTGILVTEESGLRRAIRRAENKYGEKVGGIFPERDQWIKVSRECRRETEAAELAFRQSERWEGRSPDGPAADARGRIG